MILIILICVNKLCFIITAFEELSNHYYTENLMIRNSNRYENIKLESLLNVNY